MAESGPVDHEASWNEKLVSQPWQPFSIDGNPYITKAVFDDSLLCYEFCISDFKKIWYEKIDEEKFKILSEELNPNVEAETLYLMKHVFRNVASQQANTNYQVQEDNDKLQLQLKTKLQPGVSYVWHFNCQCSAGQVVNQVLIKPIVAMVAELLRRQNELKALIHKKDMEIQDYRESDAKLSRKSLETKTFDGESFNKKMSQSSAFGHAVANASRLAFTEPAQELYKHVVERQAWLQGKDPKEEYGFSMPWDGVDSSPNVSPCISPQKITTTTTKPSAPVVSPSKERELQRREELRKKLDEEAERKKRKKKKIKL